ncbi:MAG: IscA/HesB family protein [Proteobacteria bacterium]|nr:IscA/HesB family protein [Pseudomonadota bacterium]MBU4471857.1 IscA/HesB family protein [Pseudomonadota bacterium]MCG2750637.1 IscA/HesB family protein [Desulfobacteraceae bacterium]
MFTVTDVAQNEVAEYFKTHPKNNIRVFLMEGGCGGPQLAMAIDEKKDTDKVYEVSGVSYIVENALLEKAKSIEIDFAGSGFKINSSLELGGGGCSGCSCSSDSGECCS